MVQDPDPAVSIAENIPDIVFIPLSVNFISKF